LLIAGIEKWHCLDAIQRLLTEVFLMVSPCLLGGSSSVPVAGRAKEDGVSWIWPNFDEIVLERDREPGPREPENGPADTNADVSQQQPSELPSRIGSLREIKDKAKP
jgi:hypothetical protein